MALRHFRLFLLFIFCSLGAKAQVSTIDDLALHLGYDPHLNLNIFLSDEEKAAFNYYGGFGFRPINNYLRGLPSDDDLTQTQHRIASMDDAFTKLPELPATLVVFRGESLLYRNGSPYIKNEIIPQKGYISTSTDSDYARRFMRNPGVLLILYSTQTHLCGLAMIKGEDEILLPRNLTLKIMKIRPIKNQQKWTDYVALTQVCETEATCEDTVSNEYATAEWEKEY